VRILPRPRTQEPLISRYDDTHGHSMRFGFEDWERICADAEFGIRARRRRGRGRQLLMRVSRQTRRRNDTLSWLRR